METIVYKSWNTFPLKSMSLEDLKKLRHQKFYWYYCMFFMSSGLDLVCFHDRWGGWYVSLHCCGAPWLWGLMQRYIYYILYTYHMPIDSCSGTPTQSPTDTNPPVHGPRFDSVLPPGLNLFSLRVEKMTRLRNHISWSREKRTYMSKLLPDWSKIGAHHGQNQQQGLTKIYRNESMTIFTQIIHRHYSDSMIT